MHCQAFVTYIEMSTINLPMNGIPPE